MGMQPTLVEALHLQGGHSALNDLLLGLQFLCLFLLQVLSSLLHDQLLQGQRQLTRGYGGDTMDGGTWGTDPCLLTAP